MSHPPSNVEATHDKVEYKTKHDAGTETDPRERAHMIKDIEESWDIDISPDGEREAAGEEVERDG